MTNDLAVIPLIFDSEIPDGFVSKDYDMIPGHEDLIRGTRLETGMVVLLEDSLMRENARVLEGDSSYDEYRRARAKETSRWCKVEDLSIIDRGTDGPLVEFIGLYADGTKRSRTYAGSYYWFVKL